MSNFLNDSTAYNLSNETNVFLYCETPQTFTSLNEFYTCYKYFASNSVTSTSFQIFLCVGTVIANLLIYLLLMLKPEKTVFDQILIGHSKFFY